DENGKPVANMRFDLNVVIRPGDPGPFTADTISTITTSYGNLDSARFQNFHTDAHGKARFPALIPGANYQVLANAGGMRGYRMVREFTAESGKTLDLKTIKISQTE